MKICPACSNHFDRLDWQCPQCKWVAEVREGVVLLAPGRSMDGDGFSVGFFERLFELEGKSFWFNARNRLILWLFSRYCSRKGSFLEIGCGTGFVLQAIRSAFPALAVTGAELFAEGLAFARNRIPDGAFLQLDARELPFKDEFNALGVFDVLEHIEEDDAVLAQAAKALRPGGILLVTVPQHKWLWSIVDEHSHHIRRYERNYLLRQIKNSGFEILRWGSFVSLLLPVLMANRFYLDRRRAKFVPEGELAMVNWKQNILLWVLEAERGLMRLGVDFPFGGSLFVVAKKSSAPPQ